MSDLWHDRSAATHERRQETSPQACPSILLTTSFFPAVYARESPLQLPHFSLYLSERSGSLRIPPKFVAEGKDALLVVPVEHLGDALVAAVLSDVAGASPVTSDRVFSGLDVVARLHARGYVVADVAVEQPGALGVGLHVGGDHGGGQ